MEDLNTDKYMHVIGEQAEAFEHQDNVDSEWFAANKGYIHYRPEIPGEWNGCIAFGHKIPIVTVSKERLRTCPHAWVASVDVLRLSDILQGEENPSRGVRMRFRVPGPVTDFVRQELDIFLTLHAVGFIAIKNDIIPVSSLTYDVKSDNNDDLGRSLNFRIPPKGFG